jgi:two-component system Ni(II)/redox-responsive regulator NrsR
MSLRILLVEDEQELAGAVQTVLQRQGHVVDHCADGLHGWMLLCGALARYELAIVDWMLPGLRSSAMPSAPPIRPVSSCGFSMPAASCWPPRLAPRGLPGRSRCGKSSVCLGVSGC